MLSTLLTPMETTLAERIATLRTEERLSQADFGKKIGVSGPSVSKYESGSVPDAETMKKIKNVFEVNYEWLHEGTGPMYKKDLASVAPATPQPNSTFIDTVVQSMQNQNMLISMLADKVLSLGGTLPPGMGKLLVPDNAGRPLGRFVQGTFSGTRLAQVG